MKKVTIPLELTYQEIAELAIMAHEANMTLNDFVIKIITDLVEKIDNDNERR